uniref:Major facilitator superfamily (MFS) profile domain-containing protein n=1 Tax=Rhizochromulina marina TaxID=1034831 RepID=A0A7S2WEB7_9STRA
MGSDMEMTLYAVFTVFCFLAPSVTNKLGTRFTMFLGVLGYAALVAASLVYLLGLVGRWLVILGGAVNGVGAAFMWTAQGRLMLQYSDGTDSGRIFAIFWSIFNLSAVLGGILLFAYFLSTSSSGDWSLYAVFLGLILTGACGTLMLLPPEKVKRGKEEPLLTEDLEPSSAVVVEAEISTLPWWEELVETLKLFRTEYMARLFIIFFYTGFNQPYQLVTFGNRFFTESTLGLMLSLFYTFELIGAYVSARIVDGSPGRQAAVRGYSLFFLVTTLGYICALWLESQEAHHPEDIDNRGTVALVLPGALAMAFWGFSDSQIQALAYWQLGQEYSTGTDQSRAVGFYKMVQSAGWCLGFALSPTKRLAPILQLTATAACYIVGVALVRFPGKRPNQVPMADP